MCPSPVTGPQHGAGALAIALQVLGLPADPAQIADQSGKRVLAETDLLRAARRFPVKAIRGEYFYTIKERAPQRLRPRAASHRPYG